MEEAVAELAAALFRMTRKPLRSSFWSLLELSISEFPKFILGSVLRSTRTGRIISGVYGAEPQTWPSWQLHPKPKGYTESPKLSSLSSNP